MFTWKYINKSILNKYWVGKDNLALCMLSSNQVNIYFISTPLFINIHASIIVQTIHCSVNSGVIYKQSICSNKQASFRNISTWKSSTLCTYEKRVILSINIHSYSNCTFYAWINYVIILNVNKYFLNIYDLRYFVSLQCGIFMIESVPQFFIE